jgi:cytidylate kinase
MMQKVLRIAISGKSGCGNTTVSRMVAEKLGLRFINFTFRKHRYTLDKVKKYR